jgi:riboflavin kinase/FMN adenylyltransferase
LVIPRCEYDDFMATVFLDWHEYPPPEVAGGAVTVGNFDGVHRGHQELVATVRKQADAVRGPAVVMTFDPPPHLVLHPGSERPPLMTIPQRAELLHALGANHVVVLRTGPALLALSPEAFFEDVIARQLGAKALVEGYDFRFGRGRSGTNDSLRTFCRAAGLAFEEVPQFTLNGEPVSSSRVRAALVSGDVSRAAQLLNRNYRIAGTVITGAKRGRTIGFPTANLDDVPTVLPGNGVYAVRAAVGGRIWAAAANVGPNPTFGENAQKIEVHLIGFSDDVYGKPMEVEFVTRLRETKPFGGVGELVEQLKKDVEQARQALV